jgi:hypothetical protein
MHRYWYLSRDGQVYGPYTDAQLAEAVAAGNVLPTDMLNVAGVAEWRVASAVPGLLPPPEPLSLDPDPDEIVPSVEIKTLKLTCFACFRQVKVEFEAGQPTVACPKCRAVLETGETAAPAPAGSKAFAALESPAEFKERMERKAAAAASPDGTHGAIGRAIAAGILGGMQ